ncbi:UEV-domain-containing protein [Backusella circina FSU 941]|nr:UEV-domain-containing protein [Backusella circina FSU 941]
MDIKSWLHTVLQSYQDPERTFRDVDAVLQTYLSLKPKMDTYTSNDGNTQLLLCLHGTIPITYRSIPYNIPVAFWVPKEYPKVAPIPYVKPTANMLIREGRHVDKSGMFYHQYRSSWASDQKHTFVELVAILQQIFGQEPPVYTKPTASSNSNTPIMGSPQIQESTLQRPSPSSSSLQYPPLSTSPVLSPPETQKWRVDHYGMSQNLASLNLNHGSSLPASLPSMPTPYASLSSPSPTTHTRLDNNTTDNKEVLYQKLMTRLQDYNKTDVNLLMDHNRQLKSGELNIEQEYRTFMDLKERLVFNNQVLDVRANEIDAITAKVNAMPDVAVDEALCGDRDGKWLTVLLYRMFELVADDNAISDTVYFLAKALNSERIDLATFMKLTRMLSREQFMKRALVKKITEMK